MISVLITGGSGFIGSHVVEYFLQNTDYKIIIVDRLDSTSTQHRLIHLNRNRINFIYHNLRSPFPDFLLNKLKNENIKYVLHLAASTHVDRSISNPLEFIYDNIHGIHNILWACTDLKSVEKIINFSTDEVFGPAPIDINYKEWDRYNCTNPYAATKAGAEQLSLAYANCYDLPVIITHTMNVLGERQHPEKLLPWAIGKILKKEKLILHSADHHKTGTPTRFFIHARTVANALLFLLQNDIKLKDQYNIVGDKELSSLDIVNFVSKVLGIPFDYEIRDYHKNRPGHDTRYALDGTKMESIGWIKNSSFDEELKKTIVWYYENPEWLE